MDFVIANQEKVNAMIKTTLKIEREKARKINQYEIEKFWEEK